MDDWSAVGQAISNRLDEQGMTMTELSNKADVSLTTVRELVHVLNTRDRQPRTLAKLSRTLGWPENHLVQVLRGSAPEPTERSNELDELREEVRVLRERVSELEKHLSS